uniref:HDC00382 n=1 Tax=Drosophila melanogaster TaxID=7227 RepID=Q6IHY0_DROME|nr:TPA_inf: HDC00382 [Drosophila melanogaster]
MAWQHVNSISRTTEIRMPTQRKTFPCTRTSDWFFLARWRAIPPQLSPVSTATVAIRRQPMPKDEGLSKDSRACAAVACVASFSPQRAAMAAYVSIFRCHLSSADLWLEVHNAADFELDVTQSSDRVGFGSPSSSSSSSVP